MTSIDFYLTQCETNEGLLEFACRLAEKAYRKKHSIYLHTQDDNATQALDELLWTFRQGSFLPHQTAVAGDEDTAKSPSTPQIALGHSGNIGKHNDVLVNLSNNTPEFFSRFNRLAEIVPATDAAVEKSRERYRFYKSRGYPLKVHKL